MYDLNEFAPDKPERLTGYCSKCGGFIKKSDAGVCQKCFSGEPEKQ